MKIVVYGATGDVGRQIVVVALSRRHQIPAIGRSDLKLARQPEGVAIFRADLDADTE